MFGGAWDEGSSLSFFWRIVLCTLLTILFLFPSRSLTVRGIHSNARGNFVIRM